MDNLFNHAYDIIFLLAMAWTIMIMLRIEFIIRDMTKNIEEGNGTLSMVESLKGIMKLRWRLTIVCALCMYGVIFV